jgi:hypothetical protein
LVVARLLGVFSMVGDKLYERLRKVFESRSVASEPKVYDSVRERYFRTDLWIYI